MSDEQLLRVKKMTLETEDDRICVGLIPTGIEHEEGVVRPNSTGLYYDIRPKCQAKREAHFNPNIRLDEIKIKKGW